MKKSISQKIKSVYNEKVLDTTKEWEEVGESKVDPVKSRIILELFMPFKDRLKFLITGRALYQLAQFQVDKIRNFYDN